MIAKIIIFYSTAFQLQNVSQIIYSSGIHHIALSVTFTLVMKKKKTYILNAFAIFI